MSMAEDRGVDLYLAGTGIGGAGRTTPEVEAAVRDAGIVLHLGLSGESREALHSDGRVESLDPLYTADDSPARTYGKLADRIVEAAQRAHSEGRSAVFVTYGHPLFMVLPARRALLRCAELGLEVRVLPAISSFDTLIGDSPEPLDFGAQLYEKSDFVNFELRVETRMPLVLFQFGAKGAILKSAQGVPDKEAALAQRLDELYPSEHPVYVIFSASQGDEYSTITPGTVADVERLSHESYTGTTLVVAPLDGIYGKVK